MGPEGGGLGVRLPMVSLVWMSAGFHCSVLHVIYLMVFVFINSTLKDDCAETSGSE